MPAREGVQRVRTWRVAGCGALIALACLSLGGWTGSSETAAQSVRASLARYERAGEAVVWQRSIRLEATAMDLVRVKLLAPSTAAIREVTLSADTGAEVSYAAARRAEYRARRARDGAADDELSARLAAVAPNTRLRVGLAWAPGREADLRAALAGLPVTVRAQLTGVIEVAARAHTIDRLRDLPSVMAAKLVPKRRTLAVGNALDVGQPAFATAHRLGVGLGFINAVWEPGACVYREHPDFDSIGWLPRPGASSCDPKSSGGGELFGHSTAVAGALAADRGGTSTVGLFRAKMVDIDDAFGDDANVNAMWKLNPTVVNASFTVTQFQSVRVDTEVYARRTFVFQGAGNSGGAGYAQCWTYNALCVGGYAEKSTNGYFADDSVWVDSSYRNKDGVDGREVPPIVGPISASLPNYFGTGYQGAGGTSFATPAVAGLAGLLLTTHPFRVGGRPALMRAILMASAQAHKIPDPGNGGRGVPDFNDAYDDHVGAGAPNGNRADQILANSAYLYDSKFVERDLGKVATVTLSLYDRLRVVAAWDQCPGYSVISPELNVDFDMVVDGPSRTPSGQRQHHYNLSDVDNYEVVEFTAPLGGTYTVHMSAPRWSPCGAEGGLRRARLGLAWTKEPNPPVNAPRRG